MESVSVVIPTINEAENIARLVPMIFSTLKAAGIKGEVIIVDDGSSDGTADVGRRIGEEYGNVKVIERDVKDGLGNALKRGVEEASYDAVIFMDADLSHDPKEIPRFLEALASHDVVIGSRFLSGSRLERSLMRRIISGGYNFVARNALGVRVADITSGYRAFRKEAFKSLNLRSPGPEIHSELVIRACVEGLRVGEIASSYVDRVHGTTKLNYAKVGPGYIRALIVGIYAKAEKMMR